MDNKEVKKPGGYTYCATCERDIKDNNFKIGYTEDKEGRLKTYNNNPANYRDKYYYIAVNEYETLEEAIFMERQLHKLLLAYRIRKDREWFHLENHDLIRIAFELKSDFIKQSITEENKKIISEKKLKKQERNNAIINLRKKGYSIREIEKELNVPKATVGRVVKDI